MSELWWCPTCGKPVELDVHGRCSICGSDAVVSMEANYRRENTRVEEVAELERIAKL